MQQSRCSNCQSRIKTPNLMNKLQNRRYPSETQENQLANAFVTFGEMKASALRQQSKENIALELQLSLKLIVVLPTRFRWRRAIFVHIIYTYNKHVYAYNVRSPDCLHYQLENIAPVNFRQMQISRRLVTATGEKLSAVSLAHFSSVSRDS